MSRKEGKVAEMVTTTTNKSNEKKSEDGDGAVSMSKNGDIILRIHAKPNAKITHIIELRKNEITFDKGVRSRSKVIRLTTKRTTLQEVREKLEKNAAKK